MTHTVIIRSTGNARLREVGIVPALTSADGSTPTASLSVYSCRLNNAAPFALDTVAGTVLPVASSLECSASYVFATVGTIEAGDLAVAATISAQGVAAPVAAARRSLAVINNPQLAVALNATSCDAPAVAGTNMTCTQGFSFRNSGNVRISFASLSSSTGASAPAGCTAADVMPGDNVLCSLLQPINQAHLEAGSASVAVTAQGVVASGRVSLPATASHTITTPVTQIKTLAAVLTRTDAAGTVTANGERETRVWAGGRVCSVTWPPGRSTSAVSDGIWCVREACVRACMYTPCRRTMHNSVPAPHKQ